MENQKSKELNRKKLLNAIQWNSLFQIGQAILAFCCMLILVRLLTPEDYGRASVAIGILTVISSFQSSAFISQALQLPDSVEPNWSLHWTTGFYIQLVIFLVCNLVGIACNFLSDYESISPLLHLASIGIIFDWPNQLSGAMLRRSMDFQRLRLVQLIGILIGQITTIVLAIFGWGAFAIILGSNVIVGLPFSIDMLLVRRWRPDKFWWRWPNWKSYDSAMRFGFQNIAIGVVFNCRKSIETMVFPATVGLAALGLYGRANGLFSLSVSRVIGLISESIYPILPRISSDHLKFQRTAILYTKVVFCLITFGAAYLIIEGPVLCRTLYGEKWDGVIPLITPAAIGAVGAVFGNCVATLNMALNRMRLCFLIHLVLNVIGLIPLVVLLFGKDVVFYSWVLAIFQVSCGTLVFASARQLYGKNIAADALWPPFLSVSIVTALILLLRYTLLPGPILQLIFETLLFCLLSIVFLRLLFSLWLREILQLLPYCNIMLPILWPKTARSG